MDPNVDLVYDDTVFVVSDAIVRWVDKGDEYQFLPGGRITPGDVLIRCKLDDVLMSGTDVNNDTIFHHARKIVADGQILKVAAPPRKTGLRDLYSVDVWCRRVSLE